MGNSAADPIAFALGAGVALVITVALVLALRGDNVRRGWLVAAALAAGLCALGAVDLMRYEPRETPFSNLVIGVALPVLGTLGILRGTRGVRPWVRWTLAYVAAFVLVFSGFLLGAVLASYLPF